MLQKLINGSSPYRVINSLWLELIGEHIHSSLSSFSYVIKEHVDYDDNEAANKLAKWGSEHQGQQLFQY